MTEGALVTSTAAVFCVVPPEPAHERVNVFVAETATLTPGDMLLVAPPVEKSDEVHDVAFDELHVSTAVPEP